MNTYSLAMWGEGTLACSCTGYAFRGTCSHVEAATAAQVGDGT
ncbi:MAG: hypothetical protein ACR2NO_04525 [Chloroflexota bacterium]